MKNGGRREKTAVAVESLCVDEGEVRCLKDYPELEDGRGGGPPSMLLLIASAIEYFE